MATIKDALTNYIQEQKDEDLVTMLETLVTNSLWIPEFDDHKPDILADMEGTRYYPIFSAIEEAQDEYIKVEWKEIPFIQILKTVIDTPNVHAIVINPFTDNVRLPQEIVEGLYEQFKGI